MLLRRYMQERLGFSRRKIFALMQEGEITLNDMVVDDFRISVADGDILCVKSVTYTIDIRDNVKKLIAFHKPVGYVVSSDDPHNKTVYSLLPDEFSSYRYIGRLDKDSRGLLLFSNDLDLVHRLMHPSYAGEKVYEVQLDRAINDSDRKKIVVGVQDGDDMLRAVDIGSLDSDASYRIVLQEGKKRHIRRMFSVIDYDVLDLCRVSHGGIELGNLPEGEWKIVSDGVV